MPAVAEEEPDDTTSSETQEQYHRRKSQRKFNCMHTCCAYNMQLQLHIHNVSRHYDYRGRDGTDARRTQYIFKASKLAIITMKFYIIFI